MIQISIVIVSWNVSELLDACLGSIEKFASKISLEVIVVDNNSSDKTVEMVRRDHPTVTVLANSTNRGFAVANNQGIIESHGELVLLLNPDTELRSGVLETMLNFFQTHPKAGVAGCRHRNTDLTLQHSVRRFPTLPALLLIFSKIAKLAPHLPALEHYFALDFDYKKTQLVDQVAGSFFIIRRAVLDQVGLLDENFFIWFEEVDFCRRVSAADWEVWFVTEGEIIHHGGMSFKQQLTLKKQIQFLRSAAYYFRKHGI